MLTLWSAAAGCNNRMPMCIGSFSLHSKWIGLSKRYPNSSVLRRDVESDRLIGKYISILFPFFNLRCRDIPIWLMIQGSGESSAVKRERAGRTLLEWCSLWHTLTVDQSPCRSEKNIHKLSERSGQCYRQLKRDGSLRTSFIMSNDVRIRRVYLL